jgi:hypothetical protein
MNSEAKRTEVLRRRRSYPDRRRLLLDCQAPRSL